MNISDRITELNDKGTQMLLFLSFAIVGAATVNADKLPANPVLVRSAMFWWVWAVFPVLVAVLPLKDFGWGRESWYEVVRWVKVVAMLVAVVLSGVGAIRFLGAICH